NIRDKFGLIVVIDNVVFKFKTFILVEIHRIHLDSIHCPVCNEDIESDQDHVFVGVSVETWKVVLDCCHLGNTLLRNHAIEYVNDGHGHVEVWNTSESEISPNKMFHDQDHVFVSVSVETWKVFLDCCHLGNTLSETMPLNTSMMDMVMWKYGTQGNGPMIT
nr:hypothetical protein [Tanacetum cinerariifolium]